MQIIDLFTRRGLLAALGIGTAGVVATKPDQSVALLQSLLRPGSAGGKKAIALASAELPDWAQQVGSTFVTHTAHELKLADVQGFPDRKDRPDALRDRAFVARFTVEKGGAMNPGLYNVNHPSGGTFAVYFDPPATDKPLAMSAVFG
jgi:hypothetical protein